MPKRAEFDVGDLRDSVTFQFPGNPKPDVSTGKPVVVWTTVDTVPAKVKALSGSDLTNVRQVYQKVSYSIKIRSDFDVSGKYRIIFPGFEEGEDETNLSGRQVFEVVASYPEDANRQFVKVLASEIKQG